MRHQGKLKLNWYDILFDVVNSEEFSENDHVFWTISPSKVLLHQRIRRSHGEHENPLTGIISEMVVLRGITTLLLKIEHADGAVIQMDLPDHVAIRNQLKLGETISVSLLADSIHLMAD